MGAVLAILANPITKKLAGKLIDKAFRRKKKGAGAFVRPVQDKVAASAAAGGILAVALTAIGFFFGSDLVEALKVAGIENLVPVLVSAVAAVVVFVQSLVGYFQKNED